MATMFNLPDELAEEILSRVPLTSLSSVRSTCRKWDTLSQNRVFDTSASAGRKQFLGFMLKDYKDKFRLLVWNTYLGQTRWIQPRNTYRSEDRYAIGYEKNLNYKILRIFGEYDTKGELGSIDEHLEQLAVLHVSWVNAHAVEIWVTNKIDPGAVSWIKFVRSISVFVDDLAGSFFITRKSKLLWISI
uniref:F-box domain-containing protein n=1 Tax=Brassica oleracea var. oleracea TaxID=109376 RepID=A0A0D3ADY0_BRAOL